MAEINIEVKAQVEQAVRDLGRVNKSFDLMGKANQDAAGALGVFGVSLTSLSNPLTLVATTIKASIDYTAKWADEIDDLTRVTGQSAEQASVLATVLGDYGIGLGTVKLAAKAMREEGLTPTLATMRDLAAEYQNIDGAAAKNEWGVKKLGRAYFDLTEVLSKSPKEFDELAAAAQRSGKVLSGEMVDATQAASLQLAQMGDKLDGLKIKLGVPMISVVSDAVTAMEQLVIIAQLDTIAEQERTGWISHSAAEMKRAAVLGLDYNDMLRQQAGAAGEGDDYFRRYSASLAAAQKPTENLIGLTGQLAANIGEAALAQDSFAKAQQSWNDDVAGQVQRALDELNLRHGTYLTLLALTDAELGTNMAATQGVTDAITFLTGEVAKGNITQAEFASRLGVLTRENIPSFNDEAYRAATAASAWAGALRSVPTDVHSTVTTDFVSRYSELRESAPRYYESEHRAAGGPVTAGMPYVVGERGPEVFIPRQAGTITPNAAASAASGMAAGIFIQNVNLADEMDLSRFEGMLRRVMAG